MRLRLNGNYLVQYGTILPDSVKHDGGEGFVFTIQQSPFYSNTMQEALETAGFIVESDGHGDVVWWQVVDVVTGDVFCSQTVDVEKYLELVSL